jgi:hypothetical protein
MQQLEKVLNKLNTDNKAAVKIIDLDSNKIVYVCKTAVDILEEFESAELFFEDLFQQNKKHLKVILKRKNGSTYRTIEEFIFTFSSIPTTENNQTMSNTTTLANPEVNPMFNNQFGLGASEIMNLYVSKSDAQRLFSENEALKIENKELKKTNEELKEERLENKYNTDKSKGFQEMLAGAINQLPALMAFVKGTPAVGLAGAAPAPSFSTEIKQQFADQLEKIDDSIIAVLIAINNGLNTNSDFSNELLINLKKHQLWQ